MKYVQLGLLAALLGALFLPIYTKIYYIAFYYILVIIAMLKMIFEMTKKEKIEEKFYKRWDKARKRGRWINVIFEGVRTLLIMIVSISLSQLFAHGRAPMEYVSALPNPALIWIVFTLSALSFGLGMLAWHEKEKKYYDIYYSRR